MLTIAYPTFTDYDLTYSLNSSLPTLCKYVFLAPNAATLF